MTRGIGPTNIARPHWRAVLLFCGGLLLSSCQKPEDTLGVDVLDPNDLMGTEVTDTASLQTFTRREERVRTSALSRNALGSYIDPDFGLVKAGVVTQLRLTSNNVGSGTENHALVADSLVLSLVFDLGSYAYGNLQPQRIRVFEIAEDLVLEDTTYYNDHLPQVAVVNDLVEDSRGSFTPDPFSFPVVNGTAEQPQLRIPLDLALAERLLDAWGTDDLADNAAFLQFFRGLWITPDNDAQGQFDGGIWYFDLLDAQSRLTLYYRDTRPGAEDTLSYTFAINENCVRYTACQHDPSLAFVEGLEQQLADSTLGQHHTYAQALGGSRTEIRFPHLADFSGRTLARAELTVPLEGAFYPYYQPPAQLFAFRKDDAGDDLFLPDQVGAAVGGLYDAADREYRFNITRWVQGVLNGTYANTGISLVPSSNGISANRVVLAGPEHDTRPMILELTFTTY